MEKTPPQFHGIDTEESVVATVDVMKRLFKAPNPIILLLPIIIISLLLGFISTDSQNTNVNTLLLNGILIYAIPTILSGLIAKPICRLLGGVLYIRRSFLFAFITLLIAGAIVAILKFLLMPFFPIRFNVIFIFAFATTIWLRHLILVTTSNSSHIRSLPITLLQPIISMIFLEYINPITTKDLFLIVLFFTTFFAVLLLFISLVNTPMKKNFNWNGLELLTHSLSQITEGGGHGVAELEKFFKSFSEKMDVPIQLVSIKSNQKIKALMIIPYIHPGPFGELGGSDLPKKLHEKLKDISNNILIPHSATYHDYNLAVTEECEIVAKKIRELLDDIKYEHGGSSFIRYHDSLDICAQQLGDSLLIIHTSSPNPTDDIDPAIGQQINYQVKDLNHHEAIFIDAHNCLEKGAGSVYNNTPKSDKIITLAKKAARQVKNNKVGKIQVGYAQKNDFDTKETSIGSQGIQVLTIKANNTKNAYILIDGNNMIKGLREKIINSVKDFVNDAEILTTDNHIVNVKIGGYNPVGNGGNTEELIKTIQDLLKQSIDDLEEVTIGVKSGIITGIRLFGYGNSARLSSTINAIVSTLKINTASTLLLGSILCFFIYNIIEFIL